MKKLLYLIPILMAFSAQAESFSRFKKSPKIECQATDVEESKKGYITIEQLKGDDAVLGIVMSEQDDYVEIVAKKLEGRGRVKEGRVEFLGTLDLWTDTTISIILDSKKIKHNGFKGFKGKIIIGDYYMEQAMICFSVPEDS